MRQLCCELQVRKVDSVEVANYLMERMGKGSATAELIHPDELVAGVISQVAAEPDMGELLAAFVYSSEGIALGTRPFALRHYVTWQRSR